jgi:ABC-type multidrug transport system fused ATPase/permease subunit
MQDLKTILDLLNYKQKKVIFYLGLMIVIGACLELIGISLILPVIDVIQNPDSNIYKKKFSNTNNTFGKFFENSNLIFLVLFFVYMIKNVFLGFLTWHQFKWAASIQIFFSKKLFSTYLQKPYSFHIKKNSSELYRNLDEVDMLGRAIASGLALMTEAVLILSIFVLLIFLQPVAAMLSVVSFGLMGALVLFLTKKRLMKLGKDRQIYLKNRVTNIRESFGAAFKEIKLNQSEDEFLETYHKNNSNYAKVGLKASTIQELPKYFFEQFAILVLILLLLLLDYMGKTNSDIISILGLFAVAIFRVLPSIKKILHSYQYISYGSAAINLIKTEISHDKSSKNEFIHDSKKSKILKFEKNIIFKNVSFSYDDKSIVAIEDLNLKINKNEIIGIIGESGSGKSTFVDLLSGLLAPTHGKILADNNEDIAQNYAGWQKNIGYVSQNIFLLDDTIKNNILFSKNNKDVDTNLVNSILQKSGLKKFVENLPNGLDTNIGELGSKLSGGEIQRIGIARVLYKNPKILIFDESTNALDSENELKILKTIENLKGKCTIFLISHKKINLDICDVVLELKDGIIKEIS